MATAKIATLAIRTLAKPIATQIKHQAQNHQRFRTVCIALAQFMHRTEMALRTNLLAGPSKSSGSGGGGGGGGGGGEGEKPKVRPLNEAKAVSNGANALAEGFLFALAAALIMGESYRGSRSRAKQRDRTEEGLEELRLLMQTLADRVGVNYEELQRKAKEAQEIQRASEEEGEARGTVEGEVQEGEDKEKGRNGNGKSSMAEMLYRQREADERERERLQHAVNVLLRLALKSGWIQGPEALHLESILDGSDDHREEEPKEHLSIEQQQQHRQRQQKEEQHQSPILARLQLLHSSPSSSSADVRR